MTSKGGGTGGLQLVGPPGGGDGSVPAHWPECPGYLSVRQQRRFHGICQRLDGEGTLVDADVGDIEALAIAEDNLEAATLHVNVNGKYSTVLKQGRPYQCPACKGSGVRPLPKGHAASPTDADHVPRKATGRPCSICGHPQRGEIDASLGSGETFRHIAQRFGITPRSALRHKQQHLGKPVRPVLVDPEDRTCLGCGGKGVIIPETQETSEKRPETTDQRYAIEQIAMLSAKLGLDVSSRAKVKGKVTAPRGASRLQALMDSRAPR
jgi:phage terminase small subunit